MVSGHASSHPRGFQFGIEPLSQLDVFPRRSASREDIKLRYRFKPHWNPLGCEEAWSDTIMYRSYSTGVRFSPPPWKMRMHLFHKD